VLPDPKKLFNASLDGNKWRAIDFGEGDRIDKISECRHTSDVSSVTTMADRDGGM
jgi:hypothetical protein